MKNLSMPKWNNQDHPQYEENEWSIGDVVQFGEHYGIVSFFHRGGMTVCVTRGSGTTCLPRSDVNMVVIEGTPVVPHDGSKLHPSLRGMEVNYSFCPVPHTNISKQIAKRVPVSEAVQDGKKGS